MRFLGEKRLFSTTVDKDKFPKGNRREREENSISIEIVIVIFNVPKLQFIFNRANIFQNKFQKNFSEISNPRRL